MAMMELQLAAHMRHKFERHAGQLLGDSWYVIGDRKYCRMNVGQKGRYIVHNPAGRALLHCVSVGFGSLRFFYWVRISHLLRILVFITFFSLFVFSSSRSLTHIYYNLTYMKTKNINDINNKDMSQFGLGASNTHWGYGSAASAYSPYLASSGLSSCTTPTSAQFNNPALGFTCSSNDQTNNQDFSGATNRDCVPSKLKWSSTYRSWERF